MPNKDVWLNVDEDPAEQNCLVWSTENGLKSSVQYNSGL